MSSFPQFRKKHGPPTDCRPVPAERFPAYASKLPAVIIDLWKEEGWCSYADGLIWFTDPEDFGDILSLWFDRSDHLVVFGRTAFADLLLWDGKEGQYLDVQHGTLTSLTSLLSVFFEVSLCTDRYLDRVLWRRLYRKSLHRLGQPAFNECFALEPALALGGSLKEESLVKVKMREHLALLADVVRE